MSALDCNPAYIIHFDDVPDMADQSLNIFTRSIGPWTPLLTTKRAVQVLLP